MSYLPAEHIASMQKVDEGTYWWYAVRLGWMSEAVSRARAALGRLALVDFGCGPGGLLKQLTERHAFEQVLGVDGDARMVEAARARGQPVEHLELEAPFTLPFAPSLWICADVLEHIADDRAALERMRAASAPGGFLAISVPAHQWLFSEWDSRNGHHRRYDRSALVALLQATGWRVETARYFFGFLVPVAYWTRVLRPRDQGLEFPPVSAWMNTALTWAGRIERALPISPVGTSLFCLARAA